MPLFGWLTIACWFTLISYWALSAPGAKPCARRARGWVCGMGARMVALLAFFAILEYLHVSASLPRDFLPAPIEALGVAMCVAGVAISITARRALGGNWGMPRTLRVGHELVVRGPYAYVRHPLYSGITLALAGCALVYPIWLIALVLAVLNFISSARVEEADMLELVPHEYLAYRERTKRFIPFVF